VYQGESLDKKQEAIENLRQALPHILHSFEDVEKEVPGAKAVLHVAAQRPDGSGQHLLSIEEPKELLQAIALALDIELTDETRNEHEAQKFLHRLKPRKAST
jgi:hypothetical protein